MLSFLLSLLGIHRDAARGQENEPPSRPPGFKEALKNPGILERVEEWFSKQKRDEKKAQSWSDEKVDQAVRHFIFDVVDGNLHSPEAKVLVSLGARIHAPILAILRDDALQEKLVKVTGSDGLPTTPINRLAELLVDAPSAEAVPLLANFVSDPRYTIRAAIGFAIGSAASADSIEPLHQLLADKKDHVPAMTLNGLTRAVKAKRVDPRVAQELPPDLEKLTRYWNTAESAASILLEFDRPRSIARLASPEIFTPSNPGIGGVLQAFLNHDVLVPREQMLTLIDDLARPGVRRSAAPLYAFQLIGRHRHAEDRDRLEAALKHEDSWVSKGGAAGLLAWHGLEGFEKKIWDALEAEDIARLKPSQRHWMAVFSYNAEVNNGGHSQYFFNATGDTWPDARAGLQAMGSTERLGILREALGRFGPEGPAADPDARRSQLAKLIRGDEDTFASLNDRYYKSKEQIDALLAKYVIAHAEDFR
jgi:hypothetical protein